MCGRLNIHNSPAVQQLMDRLGLPSFPARPPRYNISPSAAVDVLRAMDDIALSEWSIEFRNFRHPNTKVETIRRRPDLQQLFLKNRCLVPVNRFYEWPDAKARPKWRGVKTRFCIHTPEDVMLLGGLYKINAHGVMQFNILTTDPSPAIDDFHHRMPVIVPGEQVEAWMRSQSLDDLYRLSEPYPGDLLIYACDGYVDNGRHDDPRCMASAPAAMPDLQPRLI